ncbi:MAG TPA: hypothetical protein VF070_41150 [Streptosporangiaceae bacterium]
MPYLIGQQGDGHRVVGHRCQAEPGQELYRLKSEEDHADLGGCGIVGRGQ